MSRIPEKLRYDNDWKRGLDDMQQQGFLALEHGHLKLTALGVRHADTVAVALL